jgi:predicted 3-demethylubiquinone-9 3-methyltransferase (glyoxalase superfamily)
VAHSPVVTEIEVSGQHITLLDGGPKYKPNASISLFYICETAEEINRIWDTFAKEGTVLLPLGTYEWSEKYDWINDQYGVSWQFSLGEIEEVGQKITPCLMFVGNKYGHAEEAIEHYFSIFKNPKLDGVLRYGNNEQPEEEGKVKHAQLGLNGQKFIFMDSA